MIKCILLDWGGTIGKKGLRELLIFGTPEEQIYSVKKDVVLALQLLYNKGYTLGIVTNTKYTAYQMKTALEDIGIAYLFQFFIVSDDVCKKPCPEIFQEAARFCGCSNDQILYVGNDYIKDFLAPKKLGMNACLIKN